MDIITYLFGAGASCGALPIVNQMPIRIRGIYEDLENPMYKLDDINLIENLDDKGLKKTLFGIQTDLISELRWLYNQIINTASIDTRAKKFLLRQEHDDLMRLKIALSVFFALEQSRNGYDKRYEVFFASILQAGTIPPKRLKILSWNYDVQIEMAYSEFVFMNKVGELDANLGITHKFNADDLNSSEYFTLTKINGVAALFKGETFNHFIQHYNQPIEKAIQYVVKSFGEVFYSRRQYKSALSFAWEDEPRTIYSNVDIVSKAIQNTSMTNILVVVGYSFPLFNREVDRKIIGAMKDLKKVYFQAPDAEKLKERFLAIRNDISDENLITRFDKDQFVFPNEF